MLATADGEEAMKVARREDLPAYGGIMTCERVQPTGGPALMLYLERGYATSSGKAANP
jgi:hypothetical protein